MSKATDNMRIPMRFPLPGFLREVLDDRIEFMEDLADELARNKAGRLNEGVQAGTVLKVDVDDFDRLLEVHEWLGQARLMRDLDSEARQRGIETAPLVVPSVDLGRAKTPGERLRLLRESHNLSLRELARRSDLDASQISRLENGHTGEPWPKTKRQLAAALGSTAHEIWPKASKYEDEGSE